MSKEKELEKKIAKIVKLELDKSNYEDTAWLKSFKEARGDKNEARAIYVGIRTKDLEDEFYEEQSRFEQEKIEKENQKERAIGPLMGIAMKELRGKVSGEIINNLLLKNIKKKLENN